MTTSTRIEDAVRQWPGLATVPHRFDGRQFDLLGREVGHVHGDYQVDVPLPRRVRDVLVTEGLTGPHHLFPDSGWVTTYVETDADRERAVWLLRVAYLLQVAGLKRREAVPVEVADVDVGAEFDLLEPSAALRAAVRLPASA